MSHTSCIMYETFFILSEAFLNKSFTLSYRELQGFFSIFYISLRIIDKKMLTITNRNVLFHQLHSISK